jgi:hypothetical protein
MAIVPTAHLGGVRRGNRTFHGRRSGLGASADWKRYREVVAQRYGGGVYSIYLREEPGYPTPPNLGAISAQGAGLLSTAGAVGTTIGVSSLAAGTALGSFAGPIGAGVGALVGVIAGLFEASAARAKGAKEENTAVNEYLPSWDSGMQQIFAAANAGQITGAQAASLVPSLMQAWWAAAQQFHGLPGVADNSGGGGSCGSYTSGVTTRCSPGHSCTKACTAFCCVGCNDLWPSALDAIAILNSPKGGTLNTCTVYGSGYGATQRSGYSLTYKPPPPPPAAVTSVVNAITGAPVTTPAAGGGIVSSAPVTAASITSSLAGLVGTDATGTMTILGLPWYLVAGGGLAAFFAFRR